MNLLQTFDKADYTDDMRIFEKYTVRAVIIRDGKIAVQRSKDGECKILGGGVDPGEDLEDALLREVVEESGLLVIKDSIREAGEILEIHKDIFEEGLKFVCHSLFYFCDAKEELVECSMTESEKKKGFHLEWLTPEEIIEYNRDFMNLTWILRDTAFVEMMKNGQFGQ